MSGLITPSKHVLAVQVEQLLEQDPVCAGRVSRATIRTIAQLLLREPEPDRDVQGERMACLALLDAAYLRIGQLEVETEAGRDRIDADALTLELRRLGESIEMVRLGLHRLG